MLLIVQSICGFIIATSVLIAVHEWGHFWMARLWDIKVLRFSIGFGPALLRWFDKLGTEYTICWLPFGGYVKLLDEAEQEQEVALIEKPLAVNNKPVWVKVLVILAGPLFNLLLALFLYVIVFMVGNEELILCIGHPPQGSPAAIAGLKEGFELVAADNRAISTWEELGVVFFKHIGEPGLLEITLAAKDRNTGLTKDYKIVASKWFDKGDERTFLSNVGLKPFDPFPAVIAKVAAGLPADVAGIKAGDKIIKINNELISNRSQVIELIRAKAKHLVFLEIERNKKIIKKTVTPLEKAEEAPSAEQRVGFIGIEFAKAAWPSFLLQHKSLSVIPAVKKSMLKIIDYSQLTISLMGKMLTGTLSLRYIGGPVSIAEQAGQSIQNGWIHFVSFMALISVNLGILNVMPVPILDGGQLLYCVLEVLRGKPLSNLAKTIGQWIGVIIVVGFMSVALYNDLSRW